MKDKDKFLELIVKKNQNNFTLNDIAAFNDLQKKYDLKAENYKELGQALNLKYIQEGIPNKDTAENKWENFRTKLIANNKIASDPGITNPKSYKKLKLIAALLSAAALFLIIFNIVISNKLKNQNKLNIISTEYGSKSKVQMPDGSLIWLNSGSKITYDDHYGIKNRTVNLVGEAYFDVKHDPSHPFIIHTKNLNLKVLGTAFNVRAYKGTNNTEATLIRGSLEVSFPNRPTEKIILKPKEKLSLNHLAFTPTVLKSQKIIKTGEASPLISLSKIDELTPLKDIQEISWVDNKLIFREKSFKDLSTDLERWYNIKIDIKDSVMLEKKFTGTFKNETFIEALNALKETYSFNYNYDKKLNTITITKSKL